MDFSHANTFMLEKLGLTEKFIEQNCEKIHTTYANVYKLKQQKNKTFIFLWIKLMNHLGRNFYIRFDDFDFEFTVQYDKRTRQFSLEYVNRKTVMNGKTISEYIVKYDEFRALITDLDLMNVFDVEFDSGRKIVKMKKRNIVEDDEKNEGFSG